MLARIAPYHPVAALLALLLALERLLATTCRMVQPGAADAAAGAAAGGGAGEVLAHWAVTGLPLIMLSRWWRCC